MVVLAMLLLVFTGACSKQTTANTSTASSNSNVSTSKQTSKPTTAKDTSTSKTTDTSKTTNKKTGPTSPTTGLKLSKDFKTNPFSVTIENYPAARPQTGLAAADIVYEFEAEGRITRFLAIFYDNIPKKVGPVRSARHYFLPVANSYNIPYVHFGGSPQAYAQFGNLDIPQIDGITQGQYFERDSSRQAPHNAYLYPARLSQWNKQINPPFKFSNDNNSKNGNINTISYTYDQFTHDKYVFDSQTRLYTRYLEGKVERDRVTNNPIKVRNIIFMKANHSMIPNDPKGRINIDDTSSGDAILFTNGNKITGRWVFKNGHYHYYDSKNNEMVLNPGKTWVEIIRTNTSVTTN